MTSYLLVPLDGSDLSEAALPAATTLAGAEGMVIELLAVVEPLHRGPDPERLMSLVAQGLQARLHGIAEQLREDGLAVEVAVRAGEPAETIIAHAGDRHASLIVMTTHGLGGLDRWLVGSVADKVARFATCPVLVLRPRPDAEEAAQGWRPTKMLVPLDGSALAEQALPTAFRWAAGLDAEVLLVRAQPWLALQFAAADGYMPDLGAWEEEAAQAAIAYLEEMRAQAPAGVRVRTRVLRGEPAAQLLACCEDEEIDLVVMTSRGRGTLGRLAMGSVADRMVRHGPPVCIIHPAALETGAAAGAEWAEPV